MGEDRESGVYRGDWTSEMNQWIGWSSEISPSAVKHISGDPQAVSSDSSVYTDGKQVYSSFQLPVFGAPAPVWGHEIIGPTNGLRHDNQFPASGINSAIKHGNQGFNLDSQPHLSDFLSSTQKLTDVTPLTSAHGEEMCSSFTNSNQLMFYNNNSPFWKTSSEISKIRRDSGVSFFQKGLERPSTGSVPPKDSRMEAKKADTETAGKRPRTEPPAPFTTFKVRKEKLSDRISALQQLVSPFGKTDTASVLHEAIEYIKFLHGQVTVLSTPYMRLSHDISDKMNDREAAGSDMRSRGLCLVPISTTLHAAKHKTDFWAPTFGGSYR